MARTRRYSRTRFRRRRRVYAGTFRRYKRRSYPRRYRRYRRFGSRRPKIGRVLKKYRNVVNVAFEPGQDLAPKSQVFTVRLADVDTVTPQDYSRYKICRVKYSVDLTTLAWYGVTTGAYTHFNVWYARLPNPSDNSPQSEDGWQDLAWSKKLVVSLTAVNVNRPKSFKCYFQPTMERSVWSSSGQYDEPVKSRYLVTAASGQTVIHGSFALLIQPYSLEGEVLSSAWAVPPGWVTGKDIVVPVTQTVYVSYKYRTDPTP